VLPIQLRVAIVLKYWVETQTDDFDEDLMNNLQDFMRKMAQNSGLAKIAATLLTFLQEKVHEREQSTILWFQEPERVVIPDEGLCLSDLLLDLPSQVIAEQLTIIEFDLYRDFEVSELLNQNWNRTKSKHRSPNIVAIIQRATRVSYWMATMLLSQDVKSDRAKRFEKMVDICKCLDKLNNFNSLMGFIAGLNLSGVHRLKANKNPEPLKKFEKLLSNDGNYSAYRKRLAQTTGPCLPYIGVHLTDLTFIEDGNPDDVDGYINFKKRDLCIETISMLQQHQQTPYKCEIVDPIFTFLEELPFLDEKELYAASIFLEPRKKTETSHT